LEPLPAGHFSNWSDPGTPSLKNPKIPLQPGYLESWLSQTNYPEWRKKELRLAYDNIQNDEGLYKFTDNIHKHGVVKIFVKDEFYPEFKYPRAIWARQDEFKVIAGPIFKEIEKKLFDLPYFIKKVPKQDRPKFLHEFLECDDFIYQGTDYTSYEAHFNEDMQDDCEFELYRHMMQHNDHLKKVLHMIFQVTATYNLIKNKYFTLMTYAKRMSGEMNTSLGNGFSNLMFLKFGLHRYKIPHKGPVVEGDDALLSLKTQLPQEYYDEMGLNVKLEVFDTLGEASFCGNVFSSDELINITEPIYYLCTTPWLSKLYTHAGPKKKWELTKCKALSLAWEYPGCPILSNYAHKLLSLLHDFEVGSSRCGSWELERQQLAKQSYLSGTLQKIDPGPSTRLLMQTKYGITVEEQLQIERDIDNMTLTHFESQTALRLCPDSWKENYNNYCFKEYYTDVINIDYPPFLTGLAEKEFERIFRVRNTRIMKKMNQGNLTKKDYMELNKVRFDSAGLTIQQRNAKFDKYINKRRNINKRIKNNDPKMQSRTQYTPRSKPVRTQMKLSDCLLSYARASIDPFDVALSNVCIPDGVTVPSYKFKTTINGQFVVGTTGVGYVALNPFLGIANDWIDQNPGYINKPAVATTAAYDQNGITITPLLFTGARINTYNSSSFFTSAQVETGSMRLVAAGLEVFYTGRTLDQAGALTILQEDGLRPFPVNNTIESIRNNPRSRTCTVSKDARCYLSYYPTSEAFNSYRPVSVYAPSLTPTVANTDGVYTPLLIFVTGSTTGTSFQFKVVQYYECQIDGMDASPSHSDPAGFAAFSSARTQTQTTDDPGLDLKNTLRNTLVNLGRNVSGYLPSLGTAVGGMFGNPVIGTVAGTSAKSLLDLALNGQSQNI
jgi:hypothetical protein